MKNSINLILATFFIVLFSNQLFSQFEKTEIDINQNVVISPNGLSIRSQPNLKSKKLGVVPFGKKVNIEDSQNYGWDTIGTYDYIWGGQTEGDYSITGHWVKARYKNIRGYVFSAYLYYAHYSEYESGLLKSLNKDFALFYPGMNCYANINFEPNMNWYGLYQEKEKYYLKKTNIGFFRIYSDMLDFGITTSDNKNLLFIIGSKKPLKEKSTTVPEWGINGYPLFQQEKSEGFVALEKYGIAVKEDGPYGGFSISLNMDSKTQLLNSKEMEISQVMSIQWVGDLDGDDQLDYIIHYGEKSGQTILYLSSEAEEGEIVKPVAAYFSGYCC
jgi:hypothetical protein